MLIRFLSLEIKPMMRHTNIEQMEHTYTYNLTKKHLKPKYNQHWYDLTHQWHHTNNNYKIVDWNRSLNYGSTLHQTAQDQRWQDYQYSGKWIG